MSNNDGYYANFASFTHDAGLWGAWSDRLEATSTALPAPSALAFGGPVWISTFGPTYLLASQAFGDHLRRGAEEFDGFADKLRTIESSYRDAEEHAIEQIGRIS
jgi:hypothetical protein